MQKKIYVYPHHKLEEKVKELQLNDDNVENSPYAFIDIIGTPECVRYYLDEEENTHHCFSNGHPNVLNLEFDDIGYDEFPWKGHTFHGFSDKQAEDTYKFIKENKDRTFYLACRAGFSRSQAIGNFINEYYKGEFESDTLLKDTLNWFVHGKLTNLAFTDFQGHGDNT